jgi:hypothetical protein
MKSGSIREKSQKIPSCLLAIFGVKTRDFEEKSLKTGTFTCSEKWFYKGDNLVAFYYLVVSESGLIKMNGFLWKGPYKKGATVTSTVNFAHACAEITCQILQSCFYIFILIS